MVRFLSILPLLPRSGKAAQFLGIQRLLTLAVIGRLMNYAGDTRWPELLL